MTRQWPSQELPDLPSYARNGPDLGLLWEKGVTGRTWAADCLPGLSLLLPNVPDEMFSSGGWVVQLD